MHLLTLERPKTRVSSEFNLSNRRIIPVVDFDVKAHGGASFIDTHGFHHPVSRFKEEHQQNGLNVLAISFGGFGRTQGDIYKPEFSALIQHLTGEQDVVLMLLRKHENPGDSLIRTARDNHQSRLVKHLALGLYTLSQIDPNMQIPLIGHSNGATFMSAIRDELEGIASIFDTVQDTHPLVLFSPALFYFSTPEWRRHLFENITGRGKYTHSDSLDITSRGDVVSTLKMVILYLSSLGRCDFANHLPKPADYPDIDTMLQFHKDRLSKHLQNQTGALLPVSEIIAG